MRQKNETEEGGEVRVVERGSKRQRRLWGKYGMRGCAGRLCCIYGARKNRVGVANGRMDKDTERKIIRKEKGYCKTLRLN